MDHRRCDEVQGMLAERQSVALFYHQPAVCVVGSKELLHHAERLRGCDNGCARVPRKECCDVGRVVRLHVLDHQVVRRASRQRAVQVLLPCRRDVCVNGVHDGNLFVQNDVGIVSHALDPVLLLKQAQLGVVNADSINVFCNVHKILLYVKC